MRQIIEIPECVRIGLYDAWTHQKNMANKFPNYIRPARSFEIFLGDCLDTYLYVLEPHYRTVALKKSIAGNNASRGHEDL